MRGYLNVKFRNDNCVDKLLESMWYIQTRAGTYANSFSSLRPFSLYVLICVL